MANIVVFEGMISMPDYWGACLLAAALYGNSTAYNCQTSGSVTMKTTAGGLIGVMSESLVQLCVSSASVTVGATVGGGLVGNVRAYRAQTVIEDSRASGTVTSTAGIQVGGLVGLVEANRESVNYYGTAEIHIRRSLAMGDVIGATEVGGLIGTINYYKRREDFAAVDVSNCYAGGAVSGKANVGEAEAERWEDLGGLVGLMDLSSRIERFTRIVNSFALGAVHMLAGGIANTIGGLVGVQPVVAGQIYGSIEHSFWSKDLAGTDAQTSFGTAVPVASLHSLSFYQSNGYEIAIGGHVCWKMNQDGIGYPEIERWG